MSIKVGPTMMLAVWRSILITLLLVGCGGAASPVPDPPVQPITEPASRPTPFLAGTPDAPELATPPPTAVTATPGPETVTLTPSKDNTLYEDGQGFLSNGSGQHFFAGKSAAGAVRRAVIAFDIASSVPTGSTITQVTLTLNMSRTRNEEQIMALHRLLADWGEGASDTAGNEGSGVPASRGDATWTYRSFDHEPWREPGGDFWSTASSNVRLSGPDRYSWDSTPAMVADVQMWLDRPANNFGWLLKGNEEELRTTKRFDSRENESPENRPMLTITFVPRANP